MGSRGEPANVLLSTHFANYKFSLHSAASNKAWRGKVHQTPLSHFTHLFPLHVYIHNYQQVYRSICFVFSFSFLSFQSSPFPLLFSNFLFQLSCFFFFFTSLLSIFFFSSTIFQLSFICHFSFFFLFYFSPSSLFLYSFLTVLGPSLFFSSSFLSFQPCPFPLLFFFKFPPSVIFFLFLYFSPLNLVLFCLFLSNFPLPITFFLLHFSPLNLLFL